MKKIWLTTLVLPLFALGCGEKVEYIETGGSQSLITSDVNIQDIIWASNGLLDSMMENGVLNKAEHKPARIIVDRVINNTNTRFDTGTLLYRMRAQLVNSGQAQVVTSYGSNAESKVTQNEMKRKDFLEGKVSETDADFALTGKISQMKVFSGKNSQSTYTFRLTLTDLQSGLEVWTDLVDVSKKATQSGLDF